MTELQESANIVAPRYFGSVDYWRQRISGAVEVGNTLFDKRRKEVHRYTIADVNGPLTLTVPIVKPHGIDRATWADVRISDHGQWWHTHRIALESAYGRTPFFEFYIDRFHPFISSETSDRFASVLAMNQALEAEISSILLLDELDEMMSNLRGDGDEIATEVQSGIAPYWQPRADHFGFLPGLSILDLIFCLGPEAPMQFITHNS